VVVTPVRHGPRVPVCRRPPSAGTRWTDTDHMITGFGGVGTWKGAPDLGEYGWLRSVSAPRKEAPSSEGYKQAPGFAGSRDPAG